MNTAAPDPRAARREYFWELASSVLWGFGSAAAAVWTQTGMFAAMAVVLIMLPAIASCLWRAAFRRPRRAQYLSQAAVWFCAAALCLGWIKYAEAAAASRALEAAAKIETFRAGQGRWPESLAAAGIAQEGRPRLYYFPPDPPGRPQPRLFYPSVYNPVDRYFYDFDRRRFEFQPD
ncbi:hypothetical protein ACLD9W_08030 [Neisseria sp. WLZKY-1]|uniref:hypothetical protein n=1 Tax=Neisseria sp. WLZKY-1 TaxID=3390377 RepID=UPI00397995D5